MPPRRALVSATLPAGLRAPSVPKPFTSDVASGGQDAVAHQRRHKMAVAPWLALWVVALAVAPAGGGRVLAAFQLNAKSHWVMYEPLLRELARRGHSVTVIGHFPQKQPLPNYRDLSLDGTLPHIVNNVTFDVVEQFDLRLLVRLFWEFNIEACELAFSSEPVKRLLADPAERFDLVITEVFSVDCMAALAYRFDAPLVSLQSSVPMHWAWDRMGNPDNPSFMPSYFGRFTDRMALWERAANAALGAAYRAGHWFFERRADAVARAHLGRGMPPLAQLVRNTSLLLVNSHFSLNAAAPMVPGVVEVAGMHLAEPRPLPPDLLRFVEESAEGVVVFSLGSMMRSETMPPALMQALLFAFRALPQRVVWKVGLYPPPGLEPNKFWTASWLPQTDLLHHPKVRAFLSHGGLLSVLEAVSAGVPLVGMPLHSDQYANTRACVRRGVALALDHRTLTGEELLRALRAVIQEPSYRANARRLSEEFRDRPQAPLATAVWWTEYVMRHRGAPQLRSAAVDLSWPQLWLLDVGAALAAVLALLAASLWLMGRALFNCLCRKPKDEAYKVPRKANKAKKS